MSSAGASVRQRLGRATVLAAYVLVGVAAILVVAGTPMRAAAQTPAPAVPRLRALSLSADTVAIGDRFELGVSATIPAGMVAFLPDSLEGAGFKPLDAVRWTATERPDGETSLSISYHLIAFDIGEIVVPDFGVYAADRDESESAGLSSPGDIVGSWEAFRESPAAAPSTRVVTVPEHRVWVASVLVADETGRQVTPRPPADVSGGSRHWPSTMVMAAFGLALVAVLGAPAARMYGHARGRGIAARRLPDVRDRALLALDELLASGAHRDGRTKRFFNESSTIVRAYLEELDARWSRAWTSTELMGDLASGVARTNGREERARTPMSRELATPAMDAVTPRTEELVTEMMNAEAVKFGGARPDAATAEAHWRVVRDWIAHSTLPLTTLSTEAHGREGRPTP